MNAQDTPGDEGEIGVWVAATYGRRVRDTLVDIAELCDVAARLVARGRSAYDEDEAMRLASEAVAHRVGEAVARLGDAFAVDHPEIEWRKIKGMRNVIAHEYGRVDYEILWNTLPTGCRSSLPTSASSSAGNGRPGAGG